MTTRIYLAVDLSHETGSKLGRAELQDALGDNFPDWLEDGNSDYNMTLVGVADTPDELAASIARRAGKEPPKPLVSNEDLDSLRAMELGYQGLYMDDLEHRDGAQYRRELRIANRAWLRLEKRFRS